MARIRSIKPEFWSDDVVTRLSVPARLLYVGLWNFADDKGRLYDKPRQIHSQIFPMDPDIDVTGLLEELVESALVQRWELPNERIVLVLRNFEVHQKPQHPTPSKIDMSGAAPLSTSTFTSPRESSRDVMSPQTGEEWSGEERENIYSDSDEIVSPHEDSRDLVKSPRADIADALATVCKLDVSAMTRPAQKSFDVSVSDLVNVGATAQEVIDRGHDYHRAWPKMALTPSALVRRWSEIESAAARSQPNNIVLANFAQADK